MRTTSLRAFTVGVSIRVRLLIGISGDFREDRDGPFYVYFNIHTKSFEQTPYLRKWNSVVPNSDSNSARPVLCSDPVRASSVGRKVESASLRARVKTQGYLRRAIDDAKRGSC